MNLSAISHRSLFADCYAKNRQEIVINIRTGKDITGVNLIFADPYDVTDHKQDGYYTFPLGRFFGMWREGPCAEKDVPYQQPFVAAWPKDL